MSETALQTIPETVPVKFSQQFLGTTPQIVQLLPRDVPLDQFQAGLWMEFTTTPKLKECTPMSLIKATVKAAMKGHVPGRDCFFVPFKNKGNLEATMVEYYQGIVRALDRTGRVAWSKAEPVYKADHFRCDELQEIYEFERHLDGDRGKLRCYFSAFKLKGVEKPLVRVCTLEDVEKVRCASPGGEQDAWLKWPEEMGKKTALKKHAKYLQLVPEEEEPIPAVNNSALLFGGDEAEQSRLRATRPSVAATLTAPEPEELPDVVVDMMPEPVREHIRGKAGTRPPVKEEASDAVGGQSGTDDKPVEQEKQTREERQWLTKAMKLARQGAAAAGIGIAPFIAEITERSGVGWSMDHLTTILFDRFEELVQTLVDTHSASAPDTSWMPEAELLVWIDEEAGKRNVASEVLKGILTEYAEGWETKLENLSPNDIPEWKVWAAKRWQEDAAQVVIDEQRQRDEALTSAD